MNSKLLLWFIFIFLLIFYSIGFCQCIMGDCENGYGVANFENGDKYVGNWKNNKFHGKGKYLLKNGNYLDGEFNNGTFEGVGKQFNSSDSTAIIGNWKQGKLVDGKVEKYIGNLKIFEGKIVNGKNNGYGKYIFPNGAVYCLVVCNNLRCYSGGYYCFCFA